MLTKIEVKDRKEAHQIKLGLSDPTARAFIKVIGILTTLNSQRAKERVLSFVKDHLDEMDQS
jgi:general stress protein 26